MFVSEDLHTAHKHIQRITLIIKDYMLSVVITLTTLFLKVSATHSPRRFELESRSEATHIQKAVLTRKTVELIDN